MAMEFASMPVAVHVARAAGATFNLTIRGTTG